VSSTHARLDWSGRAWSVRDLGSLNGTWLDGQRLEPGLERVLEVDAQLCFGEREWVWHLVDAGPPVPFAISKRGRIRTATPDHLLVLPSSEEPLASVFLDSSMGWVAEDADGRNRVGDGKHLLVGGERWRLCLPEEPNITMRRTDLPVFEALRLHAVVSRDEEHVEFTLRHESFELRLEPRGHHYLMLLLAQARLADLEAGALAAADQGWVARDRLCDMLLTDTNKLNVDVYRARKQLAAAGIIGASALIERRGRPPQLRLGTDRVTIERL
jgi:hypothetical protein